ISLRGKRWPKFWQRLVSTSEGCLVFRAKMPVMLMLPVIVAMSVWLPAAALPARSEPPRPPSLLAPSFAQLTAHEHEHRNRGVLEQLRVECILRKRVVNAQLAMLRTNSPTTARFLQARSVAELVQLAQVTRGEPLKPVLRELEKRDGDGTLDGLARVAASRDK